MGFRSKQVGFTLAEIMFTMMLLSVISIMAINKLMVPATDRQGEAAIRDSFVTIGEMYMSRKDNPNEPDEAIGTSEAAVFADYLYKHMNYQEAIDPATVSDYCPATARDFFKLPMGARVQRICDTAAGGGIPATLRIDLSVPLRNGRDRAEYTLMIPAGQERYTTAYGMGVSGTCTYADKVLKLCSG